MIQNRALLVNIKLNLASPVSRAYSAVILLNNLSVYQCNEALVDAGLIEIRRCYQVEYYEEIRDGARDTKYSGIRLTPGVVLYISPSMTLSIFRRRPYKI